MSDTTIPASGGNQPSSGTAGATAPATPENGNTDTVAYETHRKLLGEKKRLQDEAAKLREQLEKIEAERKAAETAEMEKNQEYKKLLDQEREARKKMEDQLSTFRQHERDQRKLAAFLKAVDGTIEDKYWNLIDIDQISVDPDSGSVDEMSVTNTVEAFRKRYGEIIKKGTAPGLPTTQPARPQPKTFSDLSTIEKLKLAGQLIANTR